MRVGVGGSWIRGEPEWELRHTFGEFAAACKDLGRELGRRRHTIIVGGESPHFADHHIVGGLLEALDGTRPDSPLVEVMRSGGDKDSYQGTAERFPGVFGFHAPTRSRWAEVHLLRVREADCVFVIGGRHATYHAGLAAIVARKPLVPVASFGGAASRLLQDLLAIEGQGGHPPQDLLVLNGPWGSAVLEAALRRAGIGRRPRIMLIHGRNPDRNLLQRWIRRQVGLCELVVMQEQDGRSQALPEKFERLAAGTDGAIALMTPDDVGGPVAEHALTGRARQNVWLEVGWFWGHFDRSRVLLLCRGQVEIPTDLLGVGYHRYESTPTECGERVRAFVRRLGGGFQ